jgi:hypothetical protein
MTVWRPISCERCAMSGNCGNNRCRKRWGTHAWTSTFTFALALTFAVAWVFSRAGMLHACADDEATSEATRPPRRRTHTTTSTQQETAEAGAAAAAPHLARGYVVTYHRGKPAAGFTFNTGSATRSHSPVAAARRAIHTTDGLCRRNPRQQL